MTDAFVRLNKPVSGGGGLKFLYAGLGLIVIACLILGFFVGYNFVQPAEACEISFSGDTELDLSRFSDALGIINLNGVSVRAPCDDDFFKRLGIE